MKRKFLSILDDCLALILMCFMAVGFTILTVMVLLIANPMFWLFLILLMILFL